MILRDRLLDVQMDRQLRQSSRILPKKKDAVVMPEEDALASTQEDKDLFDGMLNFEYDEEA